MINGLKSFFKRNQKNGSRNLFIDQLIEKILGTLLDNVNGCGE